MMFLTDRHWPLFLMISLGMIVTSLDSQASLPKEDEHFVERKASFFLEHKEHKVSRPRKRRHAPKMSLAHENRPVPRLPKDSDLANPALILERLKTGGLGEKNLTYFCTEYSPYRNASRSHPFWNAFLLQYAQTPEGLATENTLFPLAFFDRIVTLDSQRRTVHLSPSSPEEDSITFLFPTEMSDAQRATLSPYYQALTVAALFGDARALQAQIRLKNLAEKAGCQDFLPSLLRLGLSPRGSIAEDFQTWTYVLQAFLIDIHENIDSHTTITYHHDLYHSLPLQIYRKWLNQFTQHFGQPPISLSYDQGLLVMRSAQRLGKAFTRFMTILSQEPVTLNMPGMGQVAMAIYHSVDHMMQLTQLRNRPGNAQGFKMRLTDVQPGSLEELYLYKKRYALYDAFTGKYLLGGPFVKTWTAHSKSRTLYEVFIHGLWANLKWMGLGYLSHPQNHTKPSNNIPLPLSFDDRQSRLKRKEQFLDTFASYMQGASQWLNERSQAHYNMRNKMQKICGRYNDLLTKENNKFIKQERQTVQAMMLAQESAQSFRSFNKEYQDFLGRLNQTKRLRNLAHLFLEDVQKPSTPTRTPRIPAQAIRNYFAAQNGDIAHRDPVEIFKKAAHDFEGEDIVAFLTHVIAKQETTLKRFVNMKHTLIQKKIPLENQMRLAKKSADHEIGVLKSIRDQIQRTAQRKRQADIVRDQHHEKMALFSNKALGYQKLSECLTTAFIRIQKELAALTNTDAAEV